MFNLSVRFRVDGARSAQSKHHFVLQQFIRDTGCQQSVPNFNLTVGIECRWRRWRLPDDEDERTENISRQLFYIPESQRKPVKAALDEIEWMLRDEIVAFLLDTFPITEATLAAVWFYI